MNKKAILGVIIIAFIMLVGIITISKWPITSNVINKIQNFSSESNQVTLTTSKGNIVIELYPDKAPITVENFLNYTKSGYYTNTIFHRVISGFMIQEEDLRPMEKKNQQILQ